jgi:hypothetical protein
VARSKRELSDVWAVGDQMRLESVLRSATSLSLSRSMP